MPIRYRRFYLQKLSETHEKQQEMIDQKLGKMNGDEAIKEPIKAPRKPVPIPDFVTNTNKTKASRK
jgi:hypothetical protein